MAPEVFKAEKHGFGFILSDLRGGAERPEVRLVHSWWGASAEELRLDFQGKRQLRHRPANESGTDNTNLHFQLLTNDLIVSINLIPSLQKINRKIVE